MTSLAAWPGIDSRGLSTLYIVADSRISWPGSLDHWDFGAKVFASALTPDIFGFYGDILVPSMVLPRLVEGPLLDPVANAQERHDELVKALRQSSDTLPVARRGAFGVLHGERNGEGMKSTRYLWHTHWSPRHGSIRPDLVCHCNRGAINDSGKSQPDGPSRRSSSSCRYPLPRDKTANDRLSESLAQSDVGSHCSISSRRSR